MGWCIVKNYQGCVVRCNCVCGGGGGVGVVVSPGLRRQGVVGAGVARLNVGDVVRRDAHEAIHVIHRVLRDVDEGYGWVKTAG